MILKTATEIEYIRESALLVSKTLGLLAEAIKPGVRLLELDKIAEEFIRDNNAIPGFLGLYDFPNTLCISVNEQVVHGIPNNRVLKEGDIVSIDCGVLKNNFYGDHAYTFPVGNINEETRLLLSRTKESLFLGIEQCIIGNRIGDISSAIQTYTEHFGYGVVRDLVGHGLGKSLHEEPQIPNYGNKGRGKKLQEGLVIAIEPMINLGTKYVVQTDQWNIVTRDRKHSAHFEHNIAITKTGPEILSTFEYIYEAFDSLNIPYEISSIEEKLSKVSSL